MSTVALIANWIPVVLAAAQNIPKVVQDWTAFIKNLVGAGVITKADQDALMAYLDDCLLAWAKGEVPPAWTVEPDPPTPAP